MPLHRPAPARRRFRTVAAALGAALVATGLGLIPTAAAAGGTTEISVFLKAPRPAALHHLASMTGLSRSERLARLASLVPGPAQHAAAAAALREQGMTVTGQSTWYVNATGSEQTVSERFGTRPVRADDGAGQQSGAEGRLPFLPAALRQVATAAYPTSTGPAAFTHAAATWSGRDFRNAYTSPDLTRSGGAPYDGTNPNGPLTIATLQLSSWDSNDLTMYAASHGLPMLPGQYTSVQVDGGPQSSSGDLEVDLDQESLLSTSPTSNQRAYLAPNTDAGFLGVFSQVYDDVTQNQYAASGGDPKIAALSVTWGDCEANTRGIPSYEDVLSALSAAGVTVFASTGDDGIYECLRSHAAAADYPASSPEVVAVGGTNLQSTGTSQPNNGSNWAESAWSCSSYIGCHGAGGSGGGASEVFPKPPYQAATIANGPFATSPARLIPDIAADGDPETGFQVYSSDTTTSHGCGGTNTCVLGGTSLATPVSAALLTNALGHLGATSGVGDIHAALYSAYSDGRGAFRDVTSGANGPSADAGNDPSVKAGVGYDTVTGLGAALWPAVLPYLRTTVAPTVSGALTLATPHSRHHPTRVRATWHGRQRSGGLAVASTRVTITRMGTTKPVFSKAAAAQGSLTFTGKAGSSYLMTVQAKDLGGRRSGVVSHSVLVPIDDRAFRYRGAWTRHTRHSDNRGSQADSGRRGSSASVTATGRQYLLLVSTGPRYGKLGVYRGNRRVGTVNLFSARPSHRLVAVLGSATASRKVRTLAFRYTGTKDRRAAGRTVNVDALYVTY